MDFIFGVNIGIFGGVEDGVFEFSLVVDVFI